jgi:hypothetical protein
MFAFRGGFTCGPTSIGSAEFLLSLEEFEKLLVKSGLTTDLIV